MSRVYFHTPTETAELRGSERAYAGTMTSRLALAALDHDGYNMRELLLPAVSADSYLHSMSVDSWSQSFATWWSVGLDNARLNVGGVTVTPWHLTLNTAIVAGSDAVRLLARLHATCEIHGYVEGPHRAWLASVIAWGLEDRVLRAGQGWDDVVDLLRRSDDEPVVMSYSVCDQFPDYGHLMPEWPEGTPYSYQSLTDVQKAERGAAQERIEEVWYNEMSTADKWESALAALRRTGEGNVDLHPDMWRTRGFGEPSWSVFDLVDSLRSLPSPR